MTPSKLLLSVEIIRAIYEYGMGWMLNLPLQYIAPIGDGHPVIVLPGLGTSDKSTYFIRHFLSQLGYKTIPWGLGRNLGPCNGFDPMIAQLVELVNNTVLAADGQQVSIIGWSLGGIYAREIAKIIPDAVRQVITLGTPFKDNGGTNATLLYELLCKDKSHRDPDVLKNISIAPLVPFTSLYSKTDGVVHWETSIEQCIQKLS